MSSKTGVPDAWDDDWEAAADKPTTVAQPAAAPKLTKAERRAQHQEQQKKLWDGDEVPGRKLWLEAQGVSVPLTQQFVQPVQLLSRKPPTIAKKIDAGGIEKLGLDDDEDSEEERRKKQVADLAERQKRAKLELEEKQRKYAEAKERIFGSSNASSAPDSRDSSQGRDNRRARAGRANKSRRTPQDSPAEQSPARASGNGQILFDPDDMSRRLAPKRESSNNTPKEDQPLRQPRGPSQSGRGGFGFAARGGQANS